MKNVSFSINKGEFVVVLGDTGSGSIIYLNYRKIFSILWNPRLNELS